MTTLWLVVVVLAGVIADRHHDSHHLSFISMLHDIEESDKYEKLSPDHRLMLSELIMAAEEGPAAVTHYMDRVKLVNVLQFMERLDSEDASHFEAYLATTRRDAIDLLFFLKELHTVSEVMDHLPDEDKKHFTAIMKAANDNTLTQYIDQEGYGPIFEILSHVGSEYNDDFIDLLTKHLEKEALMTT